MLDALCRRRPPVRRASLQTLFHPLANEKLDQALVLWFPGTSTATGEDLAELHLHGGRAVVSAVLRALETFPELREALPGEFTRRAFENGRIDLAEAEGLADLLAAESEDQRVAALLLAGGEMGRRVADWQERLLREAAMIESQLDFSDEGDVQDPSDWDRTGLQALAKEVATLLASPPSERLHDGIRIVLAGPPNAGKSSLFNGLIGREAAIVSDVEGTTRDRIEASVLFDGVPVIFIDTAGIRGSDDVIEIQGIARANDAIQQADIVVWLGESDDAPEDALIVAAKCDLTEHAGRPGLPVSAKTGEGLDRLRQEISRRGRTLLPRPGELAINARHRGILLEMLSQIERSHSSDDPILVAEHLRCARLQLDRITGRSGTEQMLDSLFGRFCIGK